MTIKIGSFGLATGLLFLGTAAGQASIPSDNDQDSFRLPPAATIAASPADIGGDPIIVARRGADDSPGDDHGRRHGGGHREKHNEDHQKDKHEHHGGHDDGPGHT